MILIAFGSNLSFCGQPPAVIVQRAVKALGKFVDIQAVSRFYASPSWPDKNNPGYVNAAVAGQSELAPDALMAALHTLEAGFGRRRSEKNAPRTLDIDLLAYDDIIQEGDGRSDLILPHPRIGARDFVLAPLCDIAPDWRHPGTGLTAKEMLAALSEITAKPLENQPDLGFLRRNSCN